MTPPICVKPAIIAHRGACGYLPEHTLQGVRLAHAQGAHFIEQDVVLTADSVPIVLHDVTLELTTNVASIFPKRRRDDGQFYAVDFSVAEIKSLHAHERTDAQGNRVFPTRYSGSVSEFSVPTLSEEIELVDALNSAGEHVAGVYIELKRPEYHEALGMDLYGAVCDVLEKHHRLNDQQATVIQCFDPVTLRRFQSEGRVKGPRVQLVTNGLPPELRGDFARMQTRAGVQDIAEYADGMGVHVPLLFSDNGCESELVTAAKECGLFLHPFTLRADSESLPGVNFQQLHETLLVDLDVDAVFTDFPDKTRDILHQMEQ